MSFIDGARYSIDIVTDTRCEMSDLIVTQCAHCRKVTIDEMLVDPLARRPQQ